MTIREQIERMLTFFQYAHLPDHLQEVSRPFGELADSVALASCNSETLAALRKLLEAKDAAVRAFMRDDLE